MQQPVVRSLSFIRRLFAVVLWSWSAVGLADVTQITVESQSASNQTDISITFGQVFAAGDVPTGTILGARTSTGTVLPLQVDAKATHADGSLRHAVLTTNLPTLGGNQAQPIILFESGSAPPGADVSLPDLLATSFDATVTLDVGGTIYSASARTLLQSGPVQTWLQGPLVSEWQVAAPFATATAVEHPHLTARFNVRAYAGLGVVRVSTIVENNWSLVASPQDFTYNATVTVDGSGTVLSEPAVTHYRQARWRRVFWWGAQPQIHVAHDRSYLENTAAVPAYDPNINIAESVLSGMASEWTGSITSLMGTGLISTFMPAGGGRRDIAPLPRWTARYLISQDARAKTSTIGTSEQAGSWGIHYRDKDTDLPISLDTYPNLAGLGNGGIFPACGGSCNTPFTPDTSHQPSLAYVPYLITGDHFHLEELHFWANWNLFYWGVHSGSLGLITNDQIRAQAWSMRTVGHAAYVTPDSHPLKSYFINKLNNNINWYDANYTNVTPTTLGYIVDPVGSGNSFATWMDDFLTWTMGHLVNLGFGNALPFFEYKAAFPVGRMTNPDYCWILASTYWTRALDQVTGQQFQTWADYKVAAIRSWDDGSVGPSFSPAPPNMSDAQEDPLIAAVCNSQNMANILGYQTGRMLGGAQYPDGYPSNLQPAIAVAAELGIPAADQGWATFASRSLVPQAPDTYNVHPQWAIVPRATAGPNLPTVTLTANPASVVMNASSTLNWDAINATSCTASGDWSGVKTVQGTEATGPLTVDSTYTLTCDGPGGTAADTVTVTVLPLPTVTLSANPTSVAAGASSTLTWSSTDATACTASDAWSGIKAVAGSEPTGPLTAASTFTLTCDGPGGTAADSVTVSVQQPPPAPTVTLTANPTSVTTGDNSVLTWSSTDATACTASDAWTGNKAIAGNETVGPLTMSSTYTLTCTGAGGSAALSITVTVNPGAPGLSFSGNPTAVTAGNTSVLTWTGTNVSSCTASGAWSGNKSASGNQTVGPLNASSTFTLNCSGAGGNIVQSVTVTVTSVGGGARTSSGGGSVSLLGVLLLLLFGRTSRARIGPVRARPESPGVITADL